MDAIDVLHLITEETLGAYGLTDLTVGTVTGTDPLEVKIREDMAAIPESALRLTATVVERKIPVLEHRHVTTGFRHGHALPDFSHSHALSGLSHSHSGGEGQTGPALTGSFQTENALDNSFQAEDSLIQDAFPSDDRLSDIVCYENGEALPVRDGYIILNRGLEEGDKVLLLKVMRSQQFIILSRVFEKGGASRAAQKWD